MRQDRPIGPDEVDGFFDRQRREIAARVAAEAGAPPSRAWLRPALAAAAMLALTALVVVWTGVPREAGAPSRQEEGSVAEPTELLPLPAFSAWTETASASPTADLDALEGLDWFLAEELRLQETEPYPEFLEAFGLWTEAEATASRDGSV
jgi:hypothetical protein